MDSTTPATLPTNLTIVGGYVNGAYKWAKADWDRFPGAVQLRINVTGEHGRGNVLDVETGDAAPADAPGWYDSITWIAKPELAVYCNRSNAATVVAAMGGRDWRLWLATDDGSVPRTFAGRAVDAVQYAADVAPWHADFTAVLNGKWRA